MLLLELGLLPLNLAHILRGVLLLFVRGRGSLLLVQLFQPRLEHQRFLPQSFVSDLYLSALLPIIHATGQRSFCLASGEDCGLSLLCLMLSLKLLMDVLNDPRILFSPPSTLDMLNSESLKELWRADDLGSRYLATAGFAAALLLRGDIDVAR